MSPIYSPRVSDRAFRRCVALAITAICVAGSGAKLLGQDDAPPASPADPPRTATALQLNAGISAYLRGNKTEAKDILTRLTEADPSNTAGYYYLGIIYLEEGLDASREQKPEARDLFVKAQQCLQRVVQTVDPNAIPVEAYLDLGIAQLGGEKFDKERMEISRRAAETLQEYVQTETGKTDRFGHFFLGVAYFRLATQDVRLAGQRKVEDRRKAVLAFDTAMGLAKEPVAGERLSKEDYALFETKVLYYKALLAIVGRDNQEARGLLDDVVQRGSGAELIQNANTLIKKIDEIETQEPGPITLETGAGPIQFEGFATVGHYYDTNVILLGEDTIIPRRIPHKEDYRFGLQTGFDVSRNFTERDDILGKSFYVGAGGSTSHFWQPHIKEFDINIYSGRAYVNWEPVSDIFLGIQYDYSYTKLGQDPYISSNRITPVVSKVWREESASAGELGIERARTDFYYTYDDRDYFDRIIDPRLDRDGNYHSVGVAQSFNLVQARDIWKKYYGSAGGDGATRDGRDGERWLRLRFGYLYRNERTQGREFDLWGHTIYGGIDVPLPYRFAFDFTSEFTWDDYGHPSLFDFRGNERDDFIQRYVFGITYTIIDRGEYRPMPSLSMKTRGSIELIYQNSDIWDRLSQDTYQFNRQIYGLELLVSF